MTDAPKTNVLPPGAAVDGAPTAAAEVQQALAALEAAHSFPGPFTFKAIGANTPAFTAAVLQAAVSVLGPRTQPGVTCRPSAHGRHQAVHVVAQVQDARQVLAVYAAMRGIDALKMLL